MLENQSSSANFSSKCRESKSLGLKINVIHKNKKLNNLNVQNTRKINIRNRKFCSTKGIKGYI